MTAKEDVMGEEVTLAEELAETLLGTAQEWARRWTLDNGQEVKAIWGPQGLVTLENQETGRSLDFQVEVQATQLPAPGPEHDGAAQAELADAQRHAMTAQPELGGRSPADLILQVLEAARAGHRGGCAPEACGGSRLDPCRLANALEALDHALQAEAKEMGTETAGHWHPATWKDVKTGDRIRVGGQHVAEVEVALPLTWLGSGAAQVPVKLKERGHYTMPPTGPVEVWVAALPEWAGQAFLALAEAFGEVARHG